MSGGHGARGEVGGDAGAGGLDGFDMEGLSARVSGLEEEVGCFSGGREGGFDRGFVPG